MIPGVERRKSLAEELSIPTKDGGRRALIVNCSGGASLKDPDIKVMLKKGVLIRTRPVSMWRSSNHRNTYVQLA